MIPARSPSPFLPSNKPGSRNPLKGPGGLLDSTDAGDGEKSEGASYGRKKLRRNAGVNNPPGNSNPATYAGAATTGTATTTYPSPQATPYNPINQRQTIDRSIVAAVGSGTHAQVEKLPPETSTCAVQLFVSSFLTPHSLFSFIAKHFDRDPETNEVLWFSAPPMNIARIPPPKHSITYLHFLATKNKRVKEDIDDNSAAKRPRTSVGVHGE